MAGNTVTGESGKWAAFGRRTGVSRSRRASGFTLVEVLVVLAILVILFGLLIAPLISGLDMAARGRAAARMQQDGRLALERLQRDLAEAAHVYPTFRIPVGGASPGYVADASRLILVLPARDVSGVLYQPLRFDTYPPAMPPPFGGQPRAVRYQPELVDPTQPYNEDNPFVLTRAVGFYDPSSGGFLTEGEPAGSPARELVTGHPGFDIPATGTICLDPTCPDPVHEGYWDACPGCGNTLLRYQHKGFEARARRDSGKLLERNADANAYRAARSYWDGWTPPVDANGRPSALTLAAPLGATPDIDPRLVVYRYVPPAPPAGPRQGTWPLVVFDSFGLLAPGIDPGLELRYDAEAGAVLFRGEDVVELTAADAPGGFGSATSPGGSTLAELTGGPPLSDYAYAYALVPPPSLSPVSPFTRIVLSSIRVFVLEDTSGDGTVGVGDVYVEYTRSDTGAPDEIGYREFWSNWEPQDPADPSTAFAELRFNRYRFNDALAPGRAFGGIQVRFTYRRNLTRFAWPPPPATPDQVIEMDDVVRADYASRSAYDVTLALCEVRTLDGHSPQWPNTVLNEESLSLSIGVENLGR